MYVAAVLNLAINSEHRPVEYLIKIKAQSIGTLIEATTHCTADYCMYTRPFQAVSRCLIVTFPATRPPCIFIAACMRGGGPIGCPVSTLWNPTRAHLAWQPAGLAINTLSCHCTKICIYVLVPPCAQSQVYMCACKWGCVCVLGHSKANMTMRLAVGSIKLGGSVITYKSNWMKNDPRIDGNQLDGIGSPTREVCMANLCSTCSLYSVRWASLLAGTIYTIAFGIKSYMY